MLSPGRFGATTRAGRVIGWAEWGDEHARPVIFCTGAAMTSSMGFVEPSPARIVCVDRAGLGRSEEDDAKSFDSWVEDVRAVLGVLQVSDPPAIGFSQGAPFALALAAANLTSRVALVAPQDELAHPSVRPRLHPEIAKMVDAIEANPSELERELGARADAAGFFELVLAMSSDHDRAFYSRPAFAAAYRHTLEHAFRRGPRGYVRDLVLALRRWPFRPETVLAPTTIWFGALDSSPVHSPDFGEALARRLPQATRRVLGGEGGSILWTRARQILAELLGT